MPSLRSLILVCALVTLPILAEDLTPESLQKKSVSELIDLLPTLGDQGAGFSSTMSGTEFLPIEGSAAVGAVLLGQNPPKSNPVLRELVARGAESLPALVAHLDDKRTSKIVVEHNMGIGAMWLGEEYDSPATRSPFYRDGIENEIPNNKHTITVGDLCFVALGQIVNRRFSAVRYQPTACIVINSPTASPALLKLAREEWSGFDAEKLRHSLMNDALKFERHRKGAILRLLYYMPPMAEVAMLDLLDRPLYDVYKADEIYKPLINSTDREKWRAALEENCKKYGEGIAEGIRMKFLYDKIQSEHFPVNKDKPKVFTPIYMDLFGPDAKTPWAGIEYRALSYHDLAELLDSVASMKSEQVDAKALALFRKHADAESIDKTFDSLAESCIRRLLNKGFNQEFRSFCEKRIADKSSYTEEFQKLLDLLTPR